MSVTSADFVQRFPEFASTDVARLGQIDRLIEEGYLVLSPDFYGTLYDLAVQYYVADQLSGSDGAIEAGGSGTAGKIISLTVNKSGYTESYGSGSSGANGGTTYTSPYAQRLDELRKRLALVQEL